MRLSWSGRPYFPAAFLNHDIALFRAVMERVEPPVPRSFPSAVVAVEKFVMKLMEKITDFKFDPFANPKLFKSGM